MEYGSIFGHGAYLGPDLTEEYLHRAALSSIDYYSQTDSSTAQARTLEDFKTNRYNSADGDLVYSAAQAHAFDQTLPTTPLFSVSMSDRFHSSSTPAFSHFWIRRRMQKRRRNDCIFGAQIPQPAFSAYCQYLHRWIPMGICVV